jgi:hypothetical protein
MGASGARSKTTVGAWISVGIGAVALIVAIVVALHNAGLIFPNATPAPTATSATPPAEPAEPSPRPEALTRTQVMQTNPVDYGGELRAGYTVTETHSGSCDGGSARLYGNVNAYRCTFDKYIADPCFALEDGASVYCFGDPWSTEGVLLTLAVPVTYNPAFTLPDQTPYGAWGLILTDPDDPQQKWYCSMRGGAGWEIAGHIVMYNCALGDGTGEAHVLQIDADDHPVWRALLADSSKTNIVETDVTEAWY